MLATPFISSTATASSCGCRRLDWLLKSVAMTQIAKRAMAAAPRHHLPLRSQRPNPGACRAGETPVLALDSTRPRSPSGSGRQSVVFGDARGCQSSHAPGSRAPRRSSSATTTPSRCASCTPWQTNAPTIPVIVRDRRRRHRAVRQAGADRASPGSDRRLADARQHALSRSACHAAGGSGRAAAARRRYGLLRGYFPVPTTTRSTSCSRARLAAVTLPTVKR